MRAGLIPVFFELQPDPKNPNLARAGGRAYSFDFSDAGAPTALGELGCMRFPKSHTTLRTYVDTIFKGEYKYGREVDNQWPSFRDPLLYDGTEDIPQSDWKVVYDTVLYARGISDRTTYRINKGTTFSQLPEPIQDVSTAFAEFLFNQTNGVLTDLVKAYADNDPDAIHKIWQELNDTYQDKSIFEVLRDQGWEDVIKGTNNTSRLSIFGTLGLGSGGFDAFWGTTFMEILRIKIHEDEVNQDAFVGGSSYMLSPFLTHKTLCADGQTKSLQEVTNTHVIPIPVKRIIPAFDGVNIYVEGSETPYVFPCVVLTASPTAISSSIVFDESIFNADTWNGIRNIPLTGCGKTFLAFPKAFWKGEEESGRDSIVTTVTDQAIRQVYTFDDYHWGSGSEMGVLMLSYTWGDWAHKMGSLEGEEQVQSTLRMLKDIYHAKGERQWPFSTWYPAIESAILNGKFYAINWSHERGFAGGYRMADLNRYSDQVHMAVSGVLPNRPDAAVFLAGEAIAWLGLSGWIEGALHTGINSTLGVGSWFDISANAFNNWGKVVDPSKISGTSFAAIPSPVAE
ncbi:MAG: flavin monoamine oxidase family protein [Pseudohongiellaceae bacterium]